MEKDNADGLHSNTSGKLDNVNENQRALASLNNARANAQRGPFLHHKELSVQPGYRSAFMPAARRMPSGHGSNDGGGRGRSDHNRQQPQGSSRTHSPPIARRVSEPARRDNLNAAPASPHSFRRSNRIVDSEDERVDYSDHTRRSLTPVAPHVPRNVHSIPAESKNPYADIPLPKKPVANAENIVAQWTPFVEVSDEHANTMNKISKELSEAHAICADTKKAFERAFPNFALSLEHIGDSIAKAEGELISVNQEFRRTMLQLRARTDTAVDNMADMTKVVDELIMLTRRIRADDFKTGDYYELAGYLWIIIYKHLAKTHGTDSLDMRDFHDLCAQTLEIVTKLDPKAKAKAKDWQSELRNSVVEYAKDSRTEKLNVEGENARAARFVRDLGNEKKENRLLHSAVMTADGQGEGTSFKPWPTTHSLPREPCTRSVDY